MDHRRLLAEREAHRPFLDDDVFARIGGAPAVARLVDGLYDRIEGDVALRSLFGRELDNEREAQKRFFGEWLGGDARYSERAHLPLAHRHDLLPITRTLAEQWLAHFLQALETAVPDLAARNAIQEKVRVLALAFVNEGDRPSALRAKHHGTCLRYPPAAESLALARRGDAAALRELLQRAPDVLISVPRAASLLHVAVLGGRLPVVELLLGSGVDANKPAPVAPLLFSTPLCAARAKRRKEIEARLLESGAQEDIFTHAYLGDLARLHGDLEREPNSAQASDPAVDALEITPVHHAVAAERVAVLQLLLTQAAQRREVLRGGSRALQDAAARENVALVALLLEHGADATSLGAGRWVMHPELAPLLSRAGASIDRSGAWIGLACSGNQGRRDDPEYVAALLRHGARVDDRRLTGQGTDGGRATALHYASKAGFLRTIALLLAQGADPNTSDDNGLSPLDWLARASPSVDRAAVRRLLSAPRPR